MLRSEEMLEMFFLSDRFAIDEKGILGIVVSKYRSTGEVVDFSGNERVADFFYALIKPLIDKEKETAARTSKARAAAGSKGGKAKAGKKNVANAKNVAIVSDQAIVANANFAKVVVEDVKEPETQLESGIASYDVSHQHSTSNNVVDGGVNNNIYNNTITKDEIASKIDGGGDMKENTTIINSGSSDEDSNPKRKSVVPTVGGFKLGGKPDLNSPSTTNKNNVIATLDCGSLVSPEDVNKSYALLKQAGVWDNAANELARTIPYNRVKANVDLKTKEFNEGKVKKLGAVVLKAVMEDHAASVMTVEKLRQPVKEKIPLEVLQNAERMTKALG